MDHNLRLRMVLDLCNRLDDIQAGFASDEMRRTRSLLLTWKSWSCRVLRMLFGAEEAARFDSALLDEIATAHAAAAWVRLAKRSLERLGQPERAPLHPAALRSSRVLVNARARA